MAGFCTRSSLQKQELESVPQAQAERRLDADGRIHRRLLATIDVRAPPWAVWQVLTDYERLPEVVPPLLTSEVVQQRRGRQLPPNMRRLKQLAAKQLPYLQLHTEVVLDVLEKASETRMELQFRHHKSDFDMLQVCLAATACAVSS